MGWMLPGFGAGRGGRRRFGMEGSEHGACANGVSLVPVVSSSGRGRRDGIRL